MHCLDHLGNKFKNVGEMCEHYHISRHIYDHRIRDGWSKKDALTTPSKRCIQDANGNTFASFAAMCKHHNINYGRTMSRFKRNRNIEDVTNPNVYSQANEIIDPYGIKHESKNAFCRYYGLRKQKVNQLLRKSWTIPEILKIVPRINHNTINVTCFTGYKVIQHIRDDFYLCEINEHRIIRTHNDIINDIILYLKQEEKI